MNRSVVIVEVFFCLLVFLLSNPKTGKNDSLTLDEYRLKRSQCLSLPPGEDANCQEELDSKPH